MKPSLQALWSNFPDHASYPSLKDLYTWLGGAAAKNIGGEGFPVAGNTCASRLSVAFNKSGAPISQAVATLIGAKTLGTGSGERIIFRVADFRKYLIHVLGKPSVDNLSPYDREFHGKKGVVAFTVNWIDASGHIALWNGASYRDPSHDNYSAYVNPRDPKVKTSRGEFWELP